MSDHPLGDRRTWISAPWSGTPASPAPVPCLRRTFDLPGPVDTAVLHLTAFGLCDAWINGKPVGDEVFAPGWTDYHQRIQFTSHEVTAMLRPGANVLGALLGDGWYCGHVAWQDRQVYGRKPWLLARLDIRLKDGREISVVTDGKWKTWFGGLAVADLLMGEVYDARLEPDGWLGSAFDDSNWLFAEEGDPHPETLLVPRGGPPVRRCGELSPVDIQELPDGEGFHKLIIDFGKNISGRVRIGVQAESGRTLRLRHAEVLDTDGQLYLENLRGARATDHYTCGGGDREIWEPRFTFHGFRYVEVVGLRTTDTFSASAVILHSDMAVTGSFHCSNSLLDQLQENILQGQKGNFLEVPTDCPQRDERLGWTGDAEVFAPTAAFNMDVRLFFRKWMQDVRDAQLPSGAIPLVAPMPGQLRHLPHDDGGPAWSDACVICPWVIYTAYGDREILEENYEAMDRYMDFMERHRCKGFIRSHPEVDPWGGFGDWLAFDGGSTLEGATPKDFIGTAFHAHDAAIMARVARLLGRPDDADAYEVLRANVVDAFRRRFISEKDGLLKAQTQTAYVLALRFDLAPAESRERFAAELVRLIEANNFHIGTGFVGTPYILHALSDTGHLDTAYRLLEQEEFPSWLFPVKNGATTIWERWNGWTPEHGFADKAMNSFNHYAYGAVGEWMYTTVAGLNTDPDEPGYRHIIFRPRPGGSLTWAEASLETASGKAGIRWELSGDKLRLDLIVPQGSRATLEPPGANACPVALESGRHKLEIDLAGSDKPSWKTLALASC